MSLRLHMTFPQLKEVHRSKWDTDRRSHPCWWSWHWEQRKRVWVLLSTLAPGCYAAWLAARWFPLGGSAALAHTAAPAAISCCESLRGPRSLDTPEGTKAHKHTGRALTVNFYSVQSKKNWFLAQKAAAVHNSYQGKSYYTVIGNTTQASGNIRITQCPEKFYSFTIQRFYRHFGEKNIFCFLFKSI